MLTRLRFKNWRSLRDVTIDNLTPITVLVGANSSGKTNILDALHFLRNAETRGGLETAFEWTTKDKVRTIGAEIDSPVEIELDYTLYPKDSIVHQKSTISFQNGIPSYASDRPSEKYEQISNYISLRWQLLREGFSAPSKLVPDVEQGPYGVHLIDPTARNVPLMLNFMQQLHPSVYAQFEADLQYLIGYVSQISTHRDAKETRFFVEEKSSLGHESPTISGGTAHIIAVLTAYYALDMRSAELPGLIAIEEVDNGLHPLLLSNFVELLRQYTSDPEHPRQFILTTHNPMLLNLFKPDEVRIVERDEHGDTTVNEIDKDVTKVWFEKYGEYRLGEIWTTRLLGGTPE